MQHAGWGGWGRWVATSGTESSSSRACASSFSTLPAPLPLDASAVPCRAHNHDHPVATRPRTAMRSSRAGEPLGHVTGTCACRVPTGGVAKKALAHAKQSTATKDRARHAAPRILPPAQCRAGPTSPCLRACRAIKRLCGTEAAPLSSGHSLKSPANTINARMASKSPSHGSEPSGPPPPTMPSTQRSGRRLSPRR